MKSILTMLLCIPLAAIAGFFPEGRIMPQPEAQTDTIFVSDTETTYLLFPEEVLLVDIGRTGEYFARIEGKSVFLKARNQQSGPTNILVRFGQSYFTARLIFAYLPERHLYQLAETAASSGSAAGSDVRDGMPDPASIRATLHALKEEPVAQAVRQRARHGLRLRITHLQHDRHFIYLGMQLSNSSTVDYRPDFVGFSFEEKRGRRFSRNNRYSKEVRPVAAEAPGLVPGFGEAELFYALPLYAMTSRGRLRIILREKDGARVLRISVPARKINQSPIIIHSHGN